MKAIAADPVLAFGTLISTLLLLFLLALAIITAKDGIPQNGTIQHPYYCIVITPTEGAK